MSQAGAEVVIDVQVRFLVQAEVVSTDRIVKYLGTQEGKTAMRAAAEQAISAQERSIGYLDDTHRAFITDVLDADAGTVLEITVPRRHGE